MNALILAACLGAPPCQECAALVVQVQAPAPVPAAAPAPKPAVAPAPAVVSSSTTVTVRTSHRSGVFARQPVRGVVRSSFRFSARLVSAPVRVFAFVGGCP